MIVRGVEMKREEEASILFYLSKKKFYISSTIISTFTILIQSIFYGRENIITTIFSAIYLVCSFCMVLLVKSTYDIFKERLFFIIAAKYFIIGVSSFFELFPSGLMKKLNIGISSNEAIPIFIVSFFYMVISFYISNKRNAIGTLICFLFFVAQLKCVCFYVYDYEIFLIYSIVLQLLYFFFIHRNISNFKIFYDEKVNYLIISIYIHFVLVFLFAIDQLEIINISNYFLLFLGMLSFLLLFILVVEKLLTSSYRILFSDLVKRNLELDALNNQIVAKNRELELSQMLIKKKSGMFRTFFGNIPIPLIIINSETKRISFSNITFMNLVGKKDLKELINKKFRSIVQIDNEEFTDGNYNNGFIRGRAEVNGEVKYFDMELIDTFESKDEIIILFNDITSKIKADKMKESIKNKVFEERIKNDFLSNISHDLKTPINVIYSATHLLKYFIKEKNIEGIEKYIRVSKLNCITLNRLANNLIDSSRINSDFLLPNLKVKNVVEVIEEILSPFVDYARNKDIDLIFDTNQEEVFVELDEEFMQRILLNLVSNAIKFSKNNGKIEIIVKDRINDVLVQVKDNGIGMPMEFIENAFERYSMAENNKTNGTGIGLFVVKKLVEKQGGNIFVESEVNKGTNFKIVFKKVG